MPGAEVVQDGANGAQTSLFVRGGDSDDNKILLDGVDAGDLGNQIDFGPLSTTAVESAEVYRGPDSNLFGAGRGKRRSEPDHAARHHQLPFPALSRATPEISPPRARNSRWPARTRSSITWAPSVGSKPPTICRTTSTTWPRRQLTWAGPQQHHADSRHASLRRLRNRRSQRVGLLSRRRRRHAKGSGHFSERIDRQPDHRRAFIIAFATG